MRLALGWLLFVLWMGLGVMTQLRTHADTSAKIGTLAVWGMLFLIPFMIAIQKGKFDPPEKRDQQHRVRPLPDSLGTPAQTARSPVSV